MWRGIAAESGGVGRRLAWSFHARPGLLAGFPVREPGCVQGRRRCSQCGGRLARFPGFFRRASPSGPASIALERRGRGVRFGDARAEPVSAQHVVVAIMLAACFLYLHIMARQSVLRNGMGCTRVRVPCLAAAAGTGLVGAAARGHGQAGEMVSFLVIWGHSNWAVGRWPNL